MVVVETEHLNDIPGHKDAHGHSACVANEHLGSSSENIVDEEGYQCTSKYESKHGIGVVVRSEHGYAEHNAEGDAEAAGKAVDAIDHIHGVDDANTSEDGERNANPPGIALDAP